MDELEKVKQEIKELVEQCNTLRPNLHMSEGSLFLYGTYTTLIEYRNFLKCAIRGKKELEKFLEKCFNKYMEE